MTQYSDDEIWHLYEEAIEGARQSKKDAASVRVRSAIEKLEQVHPRLRNRGFVAERIGDLFLSVVRESGRAVPGDCMENIAKLVLLSDKPLMASEALKAMLKSSNDPIKELEDAVSIAEMAMNARFTRLTQEESKEKIFNRFMQYSKKVGNPLEEPKARETIAGILDQAEELRRTGMKFEDLSEYVSKRFVRHLQTRGRLTRHVLWYRDSIALCIQMHMDPHLAAVAILQMALQAPDPTESLAAVVDRTRGSV